MEMRSRRLACQSGYSAARRVATLGAVVVASALCAPTLLADDIGYEELVARLGGAVPTGAGVRAAQCEAPEASGTPIPYGPNQTLPEFAGKTFSAQSGTPAVSSHATFVAGVYYGNNSIARGVGTIYLYEANSFLSSHLRYGQGSSAAPVAPPSVLMKVYNHSWIGGLGTGGAPVAGDLEILRRADFQMNRDDTLYCVGMNNGAASVTYPLMAMGYNGISVGRMDGDHSRGDVPAGADGPGRMKPEIVAPGNATSWAAPAVGAAALLLYDTTLSTLSSNPNADETPVIKACMLAGTTHRAGWTNNPVASGAQRGSTVKPLDAISGADLLNIDRSHLILTGGEIAGATSAAAAVAGPVVGWDYENLPATNASRFWRFTISQSAPEVSVIATWHRVASTSIAVPQLADLSLTLLRVGGDGTAVTLEGDAGAAFYGSGNVASRSAVDNIEHLYIRNLAAGDYIIQMTRGGTSTAAAPFALAWFVSPREADLNRDGTVGGLDLAVLLGTWGEAGAGDIDRDGTTGGTDLARLLSDWG